MTRTFKGRVIAEGEWKGKCVVSTQGFNTLASSRNSLIKGSDNLVVSDRGNPDLYNMNVTGLALCIPKTIGSTTGGLILQTACSLNINPAAILFSEHIDSLAASGIVLSRIWENSTIIAVDQLGKDFIDYVKTGMNIEIMTDGTVIVTGEPQHG